MELLWRPSRLAESERRFGARAVGDKSGAGAVKERREGEDVRGDGDGAEPLVVSSQSVVVSEEQTTVYAKLRSSSGPRGQALSHADWPEPWRTMT
jgi:hypothetical protein